MVKNFSQLKKIIKNYLKILNENGINIEKAILYGSYSKGLAREESDIDLVVISKDFETMNFLKRMKLLSSIAWKFKEPLEVLGYSPNEIKGKKGKSILWDEICKTGIEFH